MPSSTVAAAVSSVDVLLQGGASAAPTEEELRKELVNKERRKRKREKRKLTKKEVKQGVRPPAKMNLPLRRDGHDYQCPVDCRWFTMVGFLGHL